jgi:hypothetical protein
MYLQAALRIPYYVVQIDSELREGPDIAHNLHPQSGVGQWHLKFALGPFRRHPCFAGFRPMSRSYKQIP